MLFTKENMTKVILLNTNGKDIIKGTCVIEGDSKIVFKKISVQEVSSHYQLGEFVLVVTAINFFEVKPFIMNEFVVRARKIPEGEVLKRSKLRE